jgi:hypothetical protein
MWRVREERDVVGERRSLEVIFTWEIIVFAVSGYL